LYSKLITIARYPFPNTKLYTLYTSSTLPSFPLLNISIQPHNKITIHTAPPTLKHPIPHSTPCHAPPFSPAFPPPGVLPDPLLPTGTTEEETEAEDAELAKDAELVLEEAEAEADWWA
jgi:hypothetical protein